MPTLTRRSAVLSGLALGSTLAAAATARSWPALAGEVPSGWPEPLPQGWTESHGLSAFGELGLPADFRSLPYVDPAAPKGGTIVLEPTTAGLNQSFTTFDTLNIYILRGDGAAGMSLIFDTLMSGTLDEPDALYGLVAASVRWSADRLTYRFLLRPEARFHDGSKLTAADVAFSLDLLKTKGHPNLRTGLRHVLGASALADGVLEVTLSPDRTRETHLTVAGLPIFSEAFYTAQPFDQTTLTPPLGSSAYRVGTFDQGRTIAFDRVKDYWAKDLPINRGQGNFDQIRYEYYRERQVGFEAFKSGSTTFHEDATSINWAKGYDFPAAQDGRVQRRTVPSEAPSSIQGWWLNTRREQFKDARVRQALGCCFDFQWTNKNIMFGLYSRTVSYFQNTPMMAEGRPGPDELAVLEPFRGKVPDAVFGDAVLPPVSDGSGQDRALLGQAFKLLQAAGCKRDGTVLKLPSGEPFRIEFLDFGGALERHTQPFIRNLQLLGIDARFRVVDAAQYQSRLNTFDFDVITLNRGGDSTPGEGLRISYGSEAARQDGSQNFTGTSDPTVDALIERALQAKTRAELTTVCRALDRVLRASYYWVPMWNKPDHWLAYWDQFGWPAHTPKLDPGVLSTWWFDEGKAKQLKARG
ncbi:extracellular solute-binding protein [Lichenibacterium ramalinae]|uniref:ABC transporter substrate-binding protein n=1 Tax=Lichenibacterium ramalinae TaxID=2316527 RepID=A0A4Q2RHI0_9HYPH|nr:extracellular solute-binding protein [Lichenibacterium ramalinae]RYB06118.1 ABC transporter substrate-binding protein [Lichenibacterium ramalinae]